jgi:hypothetical protein
MIAAEITEITIRKVRTNRFIQKKVDWKLFFLFLDVERSGNFFLVLSDFRILMRKNGGIRRDLAINSKTEKKN